MHQSAAQKKILVAIRTNSTFLFDDSCENSGHHSTQVPADSDEGEKEKKLLPTATSNFVLV